MPSREPAGMPALRNAKHPSLTLLLPTRRIRARQGGNMRSKLVLFPGLLLTLAAAASGQTKITGTLSCGKPDTAYSIDVDDRTGHSVSISKFACTWTTPMVYGEVQSKDGYDVAY